MSSIRSASSTNTAPMRCASRSARSAAQGHDIRLGPQDVENNRNFATKLWNAARFAEMNGCASVDGLRSESRKGNAQPLDRARDREGGARGHRRRSKAIASTTRPARPIASSGTSIATGMSSSSKPVLTRPRRRGEGRDARHGGLGARRNPEAAAPVHAVHHRGIVGGDGAGPQRATLLALTDWPKLEGLADAKAEAEIGWVIDLVTAIRSVRAEMNITARDAAGAGRRVGGDARRAPSAGPNSSSGSRAFRTFPPPRARRRARCSWWCAARWRRCRSRA